MSSIKDRDPKNYIRLSNFPKNKRLENPSLSLIVGRILLLCIAIIKKRRQCAQSWTFDNAGNTIVFVIEYQVAGTKNHLKTSGMAEPGLPGRCVTGTPIFFQISKPYSNHSTVC